MLEKRLVAVAPQLLTANGGSDGLITVADTSFFKVKQEVIVSANTLPNLDQIEVKRIVSATAMYVGPKGGNIDSRVNVSSYTTALSAKIFANEQKRPSIPFEEYTRAVYDEEPIVADRVVAVDKYGQYYTIDNPLPVELSDGSISIGTVNAELEVQLSHKDNYPNSGDVADSVRLGDGTNYITSTNVGADVGLDVNIISGTNVEVDVDAADGDNVGLKVQQRNLSPSDLQYTKRVTAITGTSLDADTTSLDVSLHDEDGNSYATNNPLSTQLSDGTNNITSTSIGSDVGLDVNIISGANVEVDVDALDGDNIGLKVQQRNLSPSDSQYTKRVTAVTGTGVSANTTSLDVSLHDEDGNAYTISNPLPVQLSDGSISIGTVNAELEVQLSHKDNYPNSGDVADSVRLGDGTNYITSTNVGADVGLDVNIISGTNVEVDVDALDGDNIGLKVQQRNLSPSDSQYTKRVTAITGSGVYADTTSLDVSLHDQSGNAYTINNPLYVNSKDIVNLLRAPLDFFGNTSISNRTNQIEVPLDDTNYANYVDIINVSTGSISQANGQVTLTTGTNANGRYAIVSKDFVRYRPGTEIGWGFTWSFPTPSIAGVTLRIGATDDATNWTNGVYFQHDGGVFSLVYRRGGSTIFSAPTSSWIDQCSGAAGSSYVNFSGTPQAIDITKDQLARIRAGLFGHAGFIVEILAPNQTWVKIYEYGNINTADVSIFGTFDLKVAAEVKKVAAGSGVYLLRSACWAGWTGSSLTRMSEPISDRTLAQVTRTVIEGKSSSGGGTYIPVKVNPSGSLEVAIGDITGVDGQQPMATSFPVAIASDQSPVDAGVVLGDQYAPTTPDTGTTQTRLLTDPDNQLKVRGSVLTDEGTFRDDFSGTSLSPVWTTQQTGNATLSIANSLATIGSGTQSGNVSLIATTGDYGPISFRSNFFVSQRIANQTIDVGFKDAATGQQIGAFFRFTGTSNLVVSCVTQSSSDPSDIQTTTVSYSKGVTSAVASDYYIEVQPDQVTFILNGNQVAQHKLHIPGPYDAMNIYAEILNAAVVTNTNLVLDYVYFINQNSLQVNNSFEGDSLPVRIKTGLISTYGAAIAGFTYAANGTDIFTITGSDTKTIKIKHLSVDGTQTNTGARAVSLIKRSSQNTGGTSTVLTNVPYDSINPTSTAVVRYYTVNPTTLGTSLGALHVEKLIVGSANSADSDALVFSTVDASTSQDITLRSSSEVLAINMNGVTSTGNSMNIDIMWTEE